VPVGPDGSISAIFTITLARRARSRAAPVGRRAFASVPPRWSRGAASGTINRHIGPSLHRLLDRLSNTPVMVVDAAGEVVAANALVAALIGDLSGASRRERTMAWRHFTGMPARIVRSEEEEARAEAGMVGELREALSRYPSDQYLGAPSRT
jgi:transcription regulator MmyB-like protein